MPLITFKLPGGKKPDVTDTPTDTQVLTFSSAKDQWDSQDGGGGGSDTVMFVMGIANASIGTGATRFTNISGIIGNVGNTTNALCIIAIGFTWSRLSVSIGVNSGDGTAVHTCQEDTTDLNQTLTVGIGLTGEFQDLVNTDVIDNASELQYKVLNNSTTGSYQIRGYASIGTI